MKNNPAISVVVPMYNVERYIKICVDSILNQTFQDFEIIIVDDASPDNSYNICHELYGNNEKVRIVRHEKNQGLGPARNTGINNSRGKYIYFVDSDDAILPNALETLYKATQGERDVDVVRTLAYYNLFQDDDKSIDLKKLQLLKENKPEGFLSSNILHRLENFCVKDRIQYMVWLGLYKREFLLKNNITFPNCLYEDQPFSFKVICLAKNYLLLNSAVNIFRQRKSSIQHSSTINKFPKIMESILVTVDSVKKITDNFPELKDKRFLKEQCIIPMLIPIFEAQILPLYENGAITEELDSQINETLTPIFGENTFLAKYFLNGFSSMWKRATFSSKNNQLLIRERNTLSSEIVKTLRRCDIVKNKIVFVNFQGKGYGCNPKYIAEEILKQGLPYDLVWLVNDLNEAMPAKIRKIKFNSVDAVFELSTARVIITNVKNTLPFIKKKEQFFIMTWHSNYWIKYIEKDCEEQLSPHYVAESKANSAMTNLMISSSHLQTEEIKRAYWYNGKIMECGLPRNDIFFNKNEKLVEDIRRRLNIPPKYKILLYAPTFRDSRPINLSVYKFDYQKLLDKMKKKFGHEWILLLRFHPNVAGLDIAKHLYKPSSNVIDVTRYSDPQELILISDVLISDYSSVVYDFMISHKPVFILAKDIETYPKERRIKPFYFELPYKINETEDELFNDIENFDRAMSNIRVSAFLSKNKLYDDGHAAEKVVNVIKKVIDN